MKAEAKVKYLDYSSQLLSELMLNEMFGFNHVISIHNTITTLTYIDPEGIEYL